MSNSLALIKTDTGYAIKDGDTEIGQMIRTSPQAFMGELYATGLMPRVNCIGTDSYTLMIDLLALQQEALKQAAKELRKAQESAGVVAYKKETDFSTKPRKPYRYSEGGTVSRRVVRRSCPEGEIPQGYKIVKKWRWTKAIICGILIYYIAFHIAHAFSFVAANF